MVQRSWTIANETCYTPKQEWLQDVGSRCITPCFDDNNILVCTNILCSIQGYQLLIKLYTHITRLLPLSREDTKWKISIEDIENMYYLSYCNNVFHFLEILYKPWPHTNTYTRCPISLSKVHIHTWFNPHFKKSSFDIICTKHTRISRLIASTSWLIPRVVDHIPWSVDYWDHIEPFQSFCDLI